MLKGVKRIANPKMAKHKKIANNKEFEAKLRDKFEDCGTMSDKKGINSSQETKLMIHFIFIVVKLIHS